MPVYIDIETFGKHDLKKVGADAYAQQAELLLCCWAVDDGPVRTWEYGDDLSDLRDQLLALVMADQLIAHNAAFERRLLRATAGLESEPEDWLCTMAQALAHSLPASLDGLCKFYGLDSDKAKQAAGKTLIRLFGRPQPRTGKRVLPTAEPEKWADFVHYCQQDVIAMREVRAKMPRINYP